MFSTPETMLESRAGSTSLEGKGFRRRVCAIAPRLLSSAPPPHPYRTSSVLPAAFVKLGVKLSASSFFGGEAAIRREQSLFFGWLSRRRLEYFPAGATSKTVLITSDNAFLEQK